MKIKFDDKKCTGCQACQMACMDQRDIRPEKGQAPLRYVNLREQPFAYLSIGCVHCGLCIKSCPAGAIYRDKNDLVLLEREKCQGCGSCLEACPFHVITMQDGKAIKCDGCKERQKAGLLPACVHTCPTGALSI